MTEPSPETHGERDATEPETAPMPRWVPVAIGVVLVVMAALAIYTGMRYRNETLVDLVRNGGKAPARTTNAPAPPGEPEAGASLVIPGHSGENVPAANEPVAAGSPRAVITGGPGGVAATVRIWARRGVMLHVQPADTMVYVNEMPIGEAKQFDTLDEVYDFAQPGSYTVRLVAPGYREKQYVVTAAEDAAEDIARITARLDRQ